MKIRLVANIDGIKSHCIGDIEINWVNELQVYVTWKILNGKTLVASKSENYFFKKDAATKEDLLAKVITKIENFRIGRSKVFSAVEIVS